MRERKIPIFCDALDLLMRVLGVLAKDLASTEPFKKEKDQYIKHISDWRRKCKPRDRVDLKHLEQAFFIVIEEKNLILTNEINANVNEIAVLPFWEQICQMFRNCRVHDVAAWANRIVYQTNYNSDDGYAVEDRQHRCLKDCVVLLLDGTYASPCFKEKLVEIQQKF